MNKQIKLEDLKDLICEGQYVFRPNALKNAMNEGFTSSDIIVALQCGCELATYNEDSKMLVLGHIIIDAQLRVPLHIVIDYSLPYFVNLVTAFIPTDPYRIWSRERVAAFSNPIQIHERVNPLHAQNNKIKPVKSRSAQNAV